MTGPRIFLIHGFEGKPNGGWRPWLTGKLAREDIYACALPMPLPYAPKKDEWVKEIGRAVGAPDESIFLVGHSLGVPAILHYLQTLPKGVTIGGAVLVSGPYHNVDDGYRDLLESFFEPEHDFARIKESCKNFVVIHGDNDTVVKFRDAEEFSRRLSCELISIPNGGHLGGSDGWYELPQAFGAIMNFLKATS